jgi:hypothetical protein
LILSQYLFSCNGPNASTHASTTVPPPSLSRTHRITYFYVGVKAGLTLFHVRPLKDGGIRNTGVCKRSGLVGCFDENLPRPRFLQQSRPKEPMEMSRQRQLSRTRIRSTSCFCPNSRPNLSSATGFGILHRAVLSHKRYGLTTPVAIKSVWNPSPTSRTIGGPSCPEQDYRTRR